MVRWIKVFLLGVLCFLITQPLIRLPLLKMVLKNSDVSFFIMVHMVLGGVLIALSAGVFEEVGRFIFKSLLLKLGKSTFMEPIIFGVGHWFSEAVYILAPVLSGYSPNFWTLPILERMFTLFIHVGLTVMVWNGFQKNQRIKYLFMAIFAHGGSDAIIPIFMGMKNGIIIIESLLFVIAILMVVYMVRSKKLYLEADYEKKIN